MDYAAIKAEVLTTAHTAAFNYFKEQLGGNDAYPCGFAWVTVRPVHKGNTAAGKAERRVFAALGLKQDYTGKNYELWNPGNLSVQNMDAKYVGAAAAARVLTQYGFNASASQRMD